MRADAPPLVVHSPLVPEEFLACSRVTRPLPQVAPLVCGVPPFLGRSKEVYPLIAVIGVELQLGVVGAGAEALLRLAEESETEAVALPPDGLDTHHSRHRGIVGRAGIGDYLHVGYLVAHQPFQFVPIIHLPAIDIVHGLAPSDDLEVFSLLDDAGHTAQHIVGRPRLFQNRACDACHHRVAFETGMGEHALDDHLLQLVDVEGVEQQRVAACLCGLCRSEGGTGDHRHLDNQSFHRLSICYVGSLFCPLDCYSWQKLRKRVLNYQGANVNKTI